MNGTVEKYDIKTVPVSDSEIKFLAVIFGELMNQQRKEDNNEADKQI